MASPDRVEFIDVALAIYESHILKDGDFVLASGRRARSYWDIPSGEHYPKHRNTIVTAYQQLLEECEPYDTLVDVFSAPSYIAAILSDRLGVPRNTVRTPKDHGFITEIVGDYTPRDRAVVIEGVFTTGQSAYNAVKTLEKSGFLVRDVVGLIDVEQGAREFLADYNFHPYTTHRMLEEFFLEANISA